MKRSRQSSGKGSLTSAPSSDDVPGGSSSGILAADKKHKYADESSLAVALSSHDKAANLSLSDEKLWCWGERDTGFCLARATHAVDSGKYFWECEILDPESRPTTASSESNSGFTDDAGSMKFSGDAHVRLGWATAAANITAPVGYDTFGFGYRDIAGSKVNNSVRTDNYGESFSVGDVIGCHIYLDRSDPSNNEIRFFKNGIDQGTAFKGSSIQGVYFPAISLYRDAFVRVNFGPFFIYPFNHVQKVASKSDRFADLAEQFDGQYFTGTLPISELQPMSTEQKKVHGEYISQRRSFYYTATPSVTSGQDVESK